MSTTFDFVLLPSPLPPFTLSFLKNKSQQLEEQQEA
jgi:hypothetical protein